MLIHTLKSLQKGILLVIFMMLFIDAHSAFAGTIHVSSNGSDSNSGTQSGPYATIQKAIDSANSGDTILVKSGTYRQGNININKKLTIKGSGGVVHLKGSMDISNGWKYENDRWVYENWEKDFCRGTQAGDCSTFPIDYERNPYSYYADMLFIDGVPLVQLDKQSEFSRNIYAASAPEYGKGLYHRPAYTGEFVVDQVANTITTNIELRGKLVESAYYDYGIKIFPGGKGTTISGLNISHMGSTADWSSGENAALYIAADDITIQNSVIQWNASNGIFVNPDLTNTQTPTTGDNLLFQNNIVQYNGKNGMLVRELDNSEFIGNTIQHNNTEMWNVNYATLENNDGTIPSLTVAGVKVSGFSSHHLWKDNIFHNNDGKGWWCDIGCTEMNIISNIATNNYYAGIFYELSSHAIIANNILSKNGFYGLWIGESNDVKVYHNVMENNRVADVFFWEGPRYDKPTLTNDDPESLRRMEANRVTYKIGNIDFGNNIISNDEKIGTYRYNNNNGQLQSWKDTIRSGNFGDSSVGSDHHTEGFNAKFEYFDCNPIYRSSARISPRLVTWFGENEYGATPSTYTSHEDFNAQEGNTFQSHAKIVDNIGVNPFYSLNRNTWEYKLLDNSLTGCKTTPQEVTKLLGVNTDYSTPGLVEESIASDGVVFEIEDNYRVVADVNSSVNQPVTAVSAVTETQNTNYSNEIVWIADKGDVVLINFEVPKDGKYEIFTHVRAGDQYDNTKLIDTRTYFLHLDWNNLDFSPDYSTLSCTSDEAINNPDVCDPQNIGESIAPSITLQSNIVELTAGTHSFAVTNVGLEWAFLDYIKVVPVPIFEIEDNYRVVADVNSSVNHPVTSVSAVTETQNTNYSNEVVWIADKGDVVLIDFEVPKDGKYEIFTHVRAGDQYDNTKLIDTRTYFLHLDWNNLDFTPDYSTLTCSSDEAINNPDICDPQNIGESIAPSITLQSNIVELTAGTHSFAVTNVGLEWAFLDYIKVMPVQ